MQLALYCPVYGYYEKEGDIIGRSGDFYTSVSTGSLFGQLLAYQFAEWLDCPEIVPAVHPPSKAAPSPSPSSRAETTQRRPLSHIVEAGAHDGTLAKDILGWLQQYRPTLFDRLEYWILEPSEFRRAQQRKKLGAFAGKVHWHESLTALTSHPVSGIVFNNELLDALPVHRLGWDAKNHSWFEKGVTWNDNRFTWIRLPQLSGEAERFAPKIAKELLDVLPDGFSVEVSAAAGRWWQQAAAGLGEGKLVAIDYGFEADELLRPERAEGTLRSYRHHRAVPDVLSNPGEQDITAHVNFSVLKEEGEVRGLSSEAIQTQAKFLTGILAKLSGSKSGSASWTQQQRRQFQTLTHPDHLGRTFRVLIQTRRGSPISNLAREQSRDT